MGDILIRGMEMPKNEMSYIELQIWGDGSVCKRRGLAGKLAQTGTAIPLPEWHGRLIDADSFKADCLAATKEAKPDFIRYEDWLKSCAITMSFCRDIDERPTIVPAEGGGEDG